MVYYNCEVCSAIFTRNIAHIKRKKTKNNFCSKDCFNTYRKSVSKPVLYPGYKYLYIGKKPYHRVIMEKHLGRLLDRKEHVHHINKDTFDNRIENLIVLSFADHMKIHANNDVSIICEFCKSCFFVKYEFRKRRFCGRSCYADFRRGVPRRCHERVHR